MTAVLELLKEQKVYRVLSGDRVYYVVMDEGGYVNTFTDDKCRYPAGVWHWQEQEIIKAVKDYILKKEEVMSH